MVELLLHYKDLTDASKTFSDLGSPLIDTLVSDPQSGGANCAHAIEQFHSRAYELCATLNRMSQVCVEVRDEVQTLDENQVVKYPPYRLQTPYSLYPNQPLPGLPTTPPPSDVLPSDPTKPTPPGGSGYVTPGPLGTTGGTLNLPPDLLPTPVPLAPTNGPKTVYPTQHGPQG